MRKTYERINAQDIAGFGELVSDDFVEHQGEAGFPATKEGTLDFFRALSAAFPDMRMTVEDLIAGGEKTVARVRLTGTHKGEFMGVAPTAARVDVQLIDIMRFDGAGLLRTLMMHDQKRPHPGVRACRHARPSRIRAARKRCKP